MNSASRTNASAASRRPRCVAPSRGRAALLALAAVASALLAGCGIQPWVKPYEREHLADPMMQFSTDALPDKHREHVADVREAARGATGVQGGGCGCN
jgi:hypothetical protein